MIDTEKMKALATQLREWNWLNDPTPQKAADAIDTLLSELEAREADRRRLGLELEGVIIDTEQGYGFDEVCLATVKRVRAALAQRQEWGRR
ncbi:TPA: hypothetical protein QDC51_000992 [Burkholderia multivorans]|nr:hypothetical protein [Burkholderia multivorans]HDR9834241.1 hypothetical protein [Burkholderia multivorans]HDR9840126.1 hypothetical protein [Burkholderia multivorans]HDR9846714.1 hypothetical protein [Burkholderia multivorans]HDR9853123.1 hypothetical protein [Burkholderia multivorans]